MTINEAIKHLATLLTPIRVNHIDDSATEPPICEIRVLKAKTEAIKMAIDALKKQIPKKPNKGREYGFEWDECPMCECGIDEWNEDEMCGNLFCPHCGQAIDWSDEE